MPQRFTIAAASAVAIPLAITLAITLATPAHAQRAASATDTTLAPGVTYRRVVDARGPWTLHVVRVDLRRAGAAGVALRPARAHDALRGRERTSEMARRATAAGDTVLAAVNADFFDLRTGENENQQVVAGEWWKGLAVTDSPYDTFDNVHAQLALDAAHRPTIDRFALDAHAWPHGGAVVPILTINARPTGTYEGTALYTPRYGPATPRDSAARAAGPRDVDAPPPEADRPVAEAPLAAAGHRGDTLLYVRRGPVSTTTGTAIPADGAVLAAYGPRAAAVQAMADGDTIRVRLATRPRLAGGAPTLLVGGWPRIVQNGASVAADAATVEGTISRNAEVRHPRTAVGLSRDGATLWLVAVDGRSTRSVGMTLVELADALRRLGAWQALNFDGGGSTTMVVGGAVVNAPTDPDGERAVGNALLVVRRR